MNRLHDQKASPRGCQFLYSIKKYVSFSPACHQDCPYFGRWRSKLPSSGVSMLGPHLSSLHRKWTVNGPESSLWVMKTWWGWERSTMGQSWAAIQPRDPKCVNKWWNRCHHCTWTKQRVFRLELNKKLLAASIYFLLSLNILVSV